MNLYILPKPGLMLDDGIAVIAIPNREVIKMPVVIMIIYADYNFQISFFFSFDLQNV